MHKSTYMNIADIKQIIFTNVVFVKEHSGILRIITHLPPFSSSLGVLNVYILIFKYHIKGERLTIKKYVALLAVRYAWSEVSREK